MRLEAKIPHVNLINQDLAWLGLSPFGLVCLKVGGPYFVGAPGPGPVDQPALFVNV